MRNTAAPVAPAAVRRVRTRQRIRDFGRRLVYHVGGLPIALRASLDGTVSTSEAVIRRAYARRYWRPRSGGDALALALALALWPLVWAAIAAMFLRRNGAIIRQRTGRPVFRQLTDQLRLYFSSGVLPPWYYIFELHSDPTPERARSYIYRWESKGGVIPLLKEGPRAPLSELGDKAEFAELCARHQVRTAAVLGVLKEGRFDRLGDLDRNLFVKPLSGRGGKGAERWDYAAGTYRDPTGNEMDRERLIEHLKQRSVAVPLIVQERLVNHPALDALNNSALSTVRVVTFLDEAGEPEVVGAAMRMAMGSNKVVDNMHSGGVVAAADLNNGTLGPASNLGANARLGWIERHPDSGAPITGSRVPMWPEVREFAVRCHRAFADRVLIGWDIAVTADGPVLVEGNGAPDFDILQRSQRRGAMDTRLGELLAFHLSKLPPSD
jgi:hypothetical protein